MRLRYNFRLSPTPAQSQTLAQAFGCARVVYNDCLRLRDACHAAGEKMDPTVEDAYWAKSYSNSTYVPKGAKYETYRPAYRYGWESYDRLHGKKFDDVERDLASDWDNRRDGSSLSWENAKPAAKDAWKRLDSNCGCGAHAHK